jgi:hypothetical protein
VVLPAEFALLIRSRVERGWMTRCLWWAEFEAAVWPVTVVVGDVGSQDVWVPEIRSWRRGLRAAHVIWDVSVARDAARVYRAG